VIRPSAADSTIVPPMGEIADIEHEALHRDADAARFAYLLASGPLSAGTGSPPSDYSTRPPPPNE
jgi:hypothetical protein